MIIKRHNGEEIFFDIYIKEFKNELKLQPVNKRFEKVFFMPMSQLINTKTKTSLYIDGFTIIGVLVELDQEIKFYPVDEIWLIMKSIFEKKSYTISKRGVIKEDKK